MMKRMMRRMAALLCALAWALGTCAAAECPQMDAAEYPAVDGSTATLPLSRALMQAATGADEAEAEQAVRHSKTTQSFYNLVYGSADLLLVYEPSEDAYAFAREEGVELEMQPIGVDALVFLVNAGNPVDSLTREQIVGIYTGEIENWSAVGGEDRAIVAYQRNAESGSQVMMENQCMQGVEMAPPPTRLVASEMGELIDAVASYQNTADAIGYSVYYYVANMYVQPEIKLLAVDGVAPTDEAIASGEYPFTQPFYAVIRADEPEDSPARRLYDWLTTDEGRALIAQAGYVPADGAAE